MMTQHVRAGANLCVWKRITHKIEGAKRRRRSKREKTALQAACLHGNININTDIKAPHNNTNDKSEIL